MAVPDIVNKLGVKMKTFYAHRRNIMLKLKIDNRVLLYSKIFSSEKNKRRMGHLCTIQRYKFRRVYKVKRG